MKKIISLIMVLLMCITLVGCQSKSSVSDRGKYTDEEISRATKKLTRIKSNGKFSVYTKMNVNSKMKRSGYVVFEKGDEFNTTVRIVATMDIDSGDVTSVRVYDSNVSVIDSGNNYYVYKLSNGTLTANETLKADYKEVCNKYTEKEFLTVCSWFYWETICE